MYHRKLYALLHAADMTFGDITCQQLQCLQSDLEDLKKWWREGSQAGNQAANISSSSDRVNLEFSSGNTSDKVEIRHPISGESQTITALADEITFDLVGQIAPESDVRKVFWWFWRFFPEVLANQQQDALLFPAHKILPDCPLHSYNSTVSTLVGAMFSEDWQLGKPEHPYLLLFTFSPVQDFIKSSRKFLDFWAGSYLLHYLSVKLCWHIAQTYGPDAVITPTLWSQEIIDALIVNNFDRPKENLTIFQKSFQRYSTDKLDPISRFEHKQSTSLSTAGFPNVITALVPGTDAAKALGKELEEKLRNEWKAIADNVRSDIKKRVIDAIRADEEGLWEAIASEFPSSDKINPYRKELQKWQQPGCWEWNKLWDAQIENTWESYWTAVPLGNPDRSMEISKKEDDSFDDTWKEAQEVIAPSHDDQPTPIPAEEQVYQTLNVGTWWGNVQSRLGKLIQSVKNTRNWSLPASPGERSTLSGQFSAVHPNLHYKDEFRQGAGLSSGSMRLFWRVMALVYPGLFNGTEKLNAIELTKRMAWRYGGVAESLGIQVNIENREIDYEGLIRFPNLSSIAAAKFGFLHPERVQQYWEILRRSLTSAVDESGNKIFSSQQVDAFCSKTRRPFHVPKTDAAIKEKLSNSGSGYNGVMFSSKWLADDIGLNQTQIETEKSTNQVNKLRELVETAHKQSGFGEGSPADWWVIVLADGDGMGQYVSGAKLKEYKEYIIEEEVDKTNVDDQQWEELRNTKKRMGPATHVGLNRALLDFSNRLVPYLTEQRFCGKVIFSGGDDVMAVLPLEDLPEYLRSLRAAWCGNQDPFDKFEHQNSSGKQTGYWKPKPEVKEFPQRPLFTMGTGATMSMGIVIAYKSVPLPTVLENIWEAEKERAKKLSGKDGLCFRVIYGGGNTLEAVMKGELLESWYQLVKSPTEELSPLLLRLAEELPCRASVTENHQLFAKAADVIMKRRDESKKLKNFQEITDWLNAWEDWVKSLKPESMTWKTWLEQIEAEKPLGTQPKDLENLLRFSAFWLDKMVQREKWVKEHN